LYVVNFLLTFVAPLAQGRHPKPQIFGFVFLCAASCLFLFPSATGCDFQISMTAATVQSVSPAGGGADDVLGQMEIAACCLLMQERAASRLLQPLQNPNFGFWVPLWHKRRSTWYDNMGNVMSFRRDSYRGL
jgi:hypothetical protein